MQGQETIFTWNFNGMHDILPDILPDIHLFPNLYPVPIDPWVNQKILKYISIPMPMIRIRLDPPEF